MAKSAMFWANQKEVLCIKCFFAKPVGMLVCHMLFTSAIHLFLVSTRHPEQVWLTAIKCFFSSLFARLVVFPAFRSQLWPSMSSFTPARDLTLVPSKTASRGSSRRVSSTTTSKSSTGRPPAPGIVRTGA